MEGKNGGEKHGWEEDPENEMLLSCLCEEHCFETFWAKSEEQNGKKQ